MVRGRRREVHQEVQVREHHPAQLYDFSLQRCSPLGAARTQLILRRFDPKLRRRRLTLPPMPVQVEGLGDHSGVSGLQDLRDAGLQVLDLCYHVTAAATQSWPAIPCSFMRLPGHSRDGRIMVEKPLRDGTDLRRTIESVWKQSSTVRTGGRHLQRGYWRASKRWCKQMSEDAVQKALVRFANNGAPALAALPFPQQCAEWRSRPRHGPTALQSARALWKMVRGAPKCPLRDIDLRSRFRRGHSTILGVCRMLERSVRLSTEAGLRPADIYGGPNGALAQLKRLEAWFAAQRDFCFYSSSVLIIYEVRLLSVSPVPCDGAVQTLRLRKAERRP